jgi:hypothetical protein
MVLKVEECPVLVRAERSQKQVHVFVQGPPQRRRSALAVVRNHLETVHRLNPGLEPREMLPLYDNPEVAADYVWLLQQEDAGETECWPPQATHKYAIKRLLDGVDGGARRRPDMRGYGEAFVNAESVQHVPDGGSMSDHHYHEMVPITFPYTPNRTRSTSQTKPQLVLLIHGIRTHAEWQEMVRNVLQRDGKTHVVPIKYGFLDALRFWCPIVTRRVAIKILLWKINDAITLN